jgi:hypothetical protein
LGDRSALRGADARAVVAAASPMRVYRVYGDFTFMVPLLKNSI